MKRTVLLHLSDIHLREEEINSTQDLDQDIRTQLLQDLTTEGMPVEHGVDAVLITGDVAFGGREPEYESAHDWLKDLCEVVGCEETRVWVVPGNHDVHRPTIEESKLIRGVHHSIRDHNDPAAELRENLLDSEAASTLLRPFKNFNQFARRFSSTTQPDAVSWQSEDEDFILNDGSILRLRGVNSALVSNRRDDEVGPRIKCWELSRSS